MNINAATTIALQDNTTLPNGSAASPALSFASDTNTGIYHADLTDGDQIGFSTGGVNTVTIGADPGASPFTTGTLRITTNDIGTTEEFEVYGSGTEDFELGTGRGIGLFMNESTTGGPFIIWSEGTDIFNLSSDGDITTVGDIKTDGGTVAFIQGYLRLGASSFNPSGNTELVPDSSLIEVTCSNGGGCTLTMDEDFSSRGQTVRIVNIPKGNPPVPLV